VTPRLVSLRNAAVRLREALAVAETDVSRDAAIQRFEFCFELAWKAVQERTREEGLDCQSPKGCLKLAFKTGWIEDEQGWLAMIEDRNRTTHTYDEQLARDMFGRLPGYLPLSEALLFKLRTSDLSQEQADRLANEAKHRTRKPRRKWAVRRGCDRDKH
jgi:nucleotidyltransferase substrate binding protein (TIGR01987 family)